MAYKQRIDPLERFAVFSIWAVDGSFYASFRELSAWAMRYVVGSWCDEEELAWARENLPPEFCSRSAIGTCSHMMVRYRTQDDAGKSVFGGAMYEGRPQTLAEV